MPDYRDQIPDKTERDRLNRRMRTHHDQSGFFGDDGAPAPWPDDIDEWEPEQGEPRVLAPGEPPF